MIDWGIIGIGRIGLSMARNMSDKGISLSIYDKAFENKIVKKANGIEINVAGIDDLIMMKEQSARQQDIVDIEMLKKVRGYIDRLRW